MNWDHALERAADRLLDGTPSNLSEAIRYSLLAPGKRIRPRLCETVGQMIGAPEAAWRPAGVAIEMVHCFTLIHDDLPCMDDDDFRRGRPSNHKVFGEAVALLAGDALLALAIDALGDSFDHVEPAHFKRALQRLLTASGARGVIGGQAAELSLGDRVGFDELRRVFSGKTGALFEASILMPADLAGIDVRSDRWISLERSAKALGFAFQVADDLEDGAQDSDPSAKPAVTSVMYYLSPEQAGRMAESELSESVSALRRAWGQSAQPFEGIADEVRQKVLMWRSSK